MYTYFSSMSIFYINTVTEYAMYVISHIMWFVICVLDDCIGKMFEKCFFHLQIYFFKYA
jgi:hypothetical protein